MNALFVYAPVVHKVFLEYCLEHNNTTIVLLDNEVAQSENKFLERDIRALPASRIKTALEAYGVLNVRIVDQHSVNSVLAEFTTVYAAQDEIILDFIQRFAPEVTVEIVPLFMRWTKQITSVEHEVPPHRTITEDEFAKNIIDKLEREADASPDWWRQIAAAIVKEGELLVTAHNAHYPNQHALSTNGDPRSNYDAGEGQGIYTSIHAEASVIAQAARDGMKTKGLDIYVTTFPCPTCARSLVEAGIARVFYRKGYSLLDAEQILSEAGIEIVLVK